MQIENRRAVITICLDSLDDKGEASTSIGKGPRRKKKIYDDDDDDDALSRCGFVFFFFFAFFLLFIRNKIPIRFPVRKVINRLSIVKRRREETFLMYH